MKTVATWKSLQYKHEEAKNKDNAWRNLRKQLACTDHCDKQQRQHMSALAMSCCCRHKICCKKDFKEGF